MPPLSIAPDLDTARWFIEQHGAPDSLSVAVAGAHACGFPSADSDLDLKGIHVAPTSAILSLVPPSDSVDVITEFDGTPIDYTSHELGFALRLATRSQNALNGRAHSDSQTRVKGVQRNGSGYAARIMLHGKSYYLGTFPSVYEAAAARRAEMKRLGIFPGDE